MFSEQQYLFHLREKISHLHKEITERQELLQYIELSPHSVGADNYYEIIIN